MRRQLLIGLAGPARRICKWCEVEISAGKRRDAKFCSKRCRQAHHRFQGHIEKVVAASSSRRLAYADPPYPGKAHYYPENEEVDHQDLVSRLQGYDGWALSTSSEGLKVVLPLCPPDVGIASWHRGSRNNRSSRPLDAWEPVVYRGARQLVEDNQVDNSLVYISRPRLTEPNRVIGAKPAAFANWLFRLLGARPGDSFDDLYPGTGGISRAWALFDE